MSDGQDDQHGDQHGDHAQRDPASGPGPAWIADGDERPTREEQEPRFEGVVGAFPQRPSDVGAASAADATDDAPAGAGDDAPAGAGDDAPAGAGDDAPAEADDTEPVESVAGGQDRMADAPPHTGDAQVDAALVAAAAVHDAEPAEQLETYVGTHRSLQDRLADSGA